MSQKQTGASKWLGTTKDNKNPWGGNKQTPPELEEVIKDFKNKFNTRFGGGGGSSGKGGVSKAARGSLKILRNTWLYYFGYCLVSILLIQLRKVLF